MGLDDSLGEVEKRCEPRKKPDLAFHDTGCLMGILIMVYCNPHITQWYKIFPYVPYPKQPGLFSMLIC